MYSKPISEGYHSDNFVLQFRNTTPEANSVIFLIFNADGILDNLNAPFLF